MLLVGIASLLIGAPAHGASTGGSDHFDVGLVSEGAAIQPGRPFYVGLRMEPEPGWHTYWKNPGDAGLPLRVEWTLPPGFTAGPIEWPAPVRFESGPLVSYGYDRDVLLTVRITPPERIAARSVTIAGKFEWLECEEVCVPGSAALELRLPVRDGEPSVGPAASIFATARAGRPAVPSGWDISAEAGPRAVALTVRPPAGVSATGGYFFADQPLLVEYAAPQGFERVEDRYRLTATPALNRTGFPKRLTGVLRLEGAGSGGARTALEVDVPLSPGNPAPAGAASSDAGAAATSASAGPGPTSGAAGNPRIPVVAIAVAAALGGLWFILSRRRKPKETK